MRVFYISAFGVCGVLARYFLGMGVAKSVARWSVSPFPYSTLAINVSGSFLIGAVYVLGLRWAAFSPDLRAGLIVGFLGGFTTFSAYSLEIARLMEDTRYGAAFLYILLSTFLGIAAVFGGMAIAKKFA